MRIGEILLEHAWVEWETIALALGDQRGSGLRICSFLVSRGALTFDHAARALGQQHGVAAALGRHLVHRDRALAALMPPLLMRSACALPIGRMRDGTLIVCVRDPSPALETQLAHALDDTFMLAVAPAAQLERLIEHAIATRELDIDIDVDPGVSGELDVDFEEAPDDQAGFDDLVIDVDAAPVRAAPKNRALPVQIKAVAVARPVAADSLEGVMAAFKDIDDLEWLLDVSMTYLGKQWTASLVLELGEAGARGLRGHGAHLDGAAARAFTPAIAAGSLVSLARDRRQLVFDEAAGAADAALVAKLGTDQLVVAPVLRGDAVSHVIVAGAPRGGEREDAAIELGTLGEAIGEALSRIG